MKILIVDDDNLARETYVNVFKKADYEVISAVDGLQGVDLAVNERPDVIFTGIIMPKMDGFSMMESLKKNVTTSGIPVIISSHLGREEDQKRAKELGAKGFVVQGITHPSEVVDLVKTIFTKNFYNLNINNDALDARRLADDLGIIEYRCKNCGSGLVLQVKMDGVNKDSFSGKFVCLQCNK